MKTERPKGNKATTQHFVEIEAIKDDVLMLKDLSCCAIIESGAVNFELLAVEEQQSMIYSFASLLNSLSFAVQIVILSKRMDISSYLDFLEEKTHSQNEPVLQQKMQEYTDFIKSIIKKNTILEKKFYFVVPFSPLELGVKGAASKGIKKEYIFTRAKTALYPKRDHLLRLLKKIGLNGKPLYEQDIAELYYNLYNASATGRKLAPIKNYTDIVLTT